MAELNRGADALSPAIRSGISIIDLHLDGGLAAGRIHLLTGGVGTGKTTACLQFLGAGIQDGERTLLLTSSRPEDVRTRAKHAGVAINEALRDGRLVALKYRPAFASRLAHAVSARVAIEDLRRVIGRHAPSRIAIDPIVPFVDNGSPSGEGLSALADCLEDLGATALLTYPGDVSKGIDRRFDGLTGRAATVIHLTRGDGGELSFSMLRGADFGDAGTPVPYAIAQRAGIIASPARQQAAVRATMSPSASRRLKLLHATPAFTAEILELLQTDFELSVAPLPPIPPVDAGGADRVGAIVIETHYGSLDAARAFVRAAAARSGDVPIVIVVRFNLRSIDRARLLRDGADEVLATDMSPAELLQRLAAAVSRGHLERPVVHYSERVVTQADASAGRPGPLDRAAFSGALASHVAHDRPTQYTVVTLAPARATQEDNDARLSLEKLAEVGMRTARMVNGDLVACFDGRVLVYLHSARRSEAAQFVDRARSAWTARGTGPLDVDFFAYPSDEPRLRTLIGTSGPA